MGAKDSAIGDDGVMRWTGRVGKKTVPIAEATIERLFDWHERPPTVTWRTTPIERLASAPTPEDHDAAAELAFATATHTGAIAVQGVPEEGRVEFVALRTFRRTSTESADKRDKACSQFVRSRRGGARSRAALRRRVAAE